MNVMRELQHRPAQALAEHVAGLLRQAVAQHGQAALAVSGGSTPLAMFQALAQQALPWAQVLVTLVDERVVPQDHADSNARLVRQHLLQGPAAQARFVPLVEAGAALDDLPALARHADARITAAWGAQPFDVLLLGMGEDGHTASLFAGAAGVQAAVEASPGRRYFAVQPAALVRHARLTLGLAEILRARHGVVQITGAAKQALLQRAQQGEQALLPLSWVLARRAQAMELWRTDV